MTPPADPGNEVAAGRSLIVAAAAEGDIGAEDVLIK
jgi:hypothetical protein